MIFSSNIKNSGGIILSIITMMLGLALIFIPYEDLVSFIFTIVGICIMLVNLIPCIFSWIEYQSTKQGLYTAIASTISLLLGFIFIFCQGLARDIISVILAIWLIALPIIRLVKSNDKKNQIKKEIPYFIIGFILLFVPTGNIFSIVLKVFGGIIVLYGIINLIFSVKNNKSNNNDGRPNNNNNNRNNSGRIIIDAEYKDVE